MDHRRTINSDLYGIQFVAEYDLDYVRWTDQGAFLLRRPIVCGEPGTEFKLRDMDGDCYVNLVDLAMFSAEWGQCTDPANEVDCPPPDPCSP